MKENCQTTSQIRASDEPGGNEDIVRSLHKLKGQFDDERRSLQEQMETLDRKAAAVDLLLGSDSDGSEAAYTADTMASEVNETETNAGPVSGSATVQDIAHCRTQREASYVIAKKNAREIDLTSAAVVIQEAGLSKGMLSTVVSSLHHFMTHSDDWNWIGPSRFELVADPESERSADSMGHSNEAGLAR